MNIEIGASTLVSMAPPCETRWGFWNFPYLFRMPDGALALTHHVDHDTEETYGKTAPLFVSRDEGRSWHSLQPPCPELGLHPTFMMHLNDGECFTSVGRGVIPLNRLRSTQPIGSLWCYCDSNLYDLASLEEEDRYIPLVRWLPKRRKWISEKGILDVPQALVWERGGNVSTFFLESKPILARDGAIIVADFRTPVRMPDGSTPTRRGTMILQSTDRGHSWQLRSIVAYDRQITYAEPFLAYAPNGELLCTLRTTCREEKDEPLHLARSGDDGRTWSAPEQIAEVGVFPNILTLGCGVSVISFGRPGMWLMFSDDGAGRRWGNRRTLVEPDPKNNCAATCGYSSMEALDARRFLVAHTIFRHIDVAGCPRKAIVVREVRVDP
ncbi:MAG: glycoside hydrolase [Verrucomicrobia bacterium]|nr:glycoside hydrolase [Verrucomicrobiota bacterium]MBU4291055.1 glycoside hydrolase [Verrucomicrobiota bacterium]MBU4498346.1 glycoside hydrolase [Verrucomicrobiota bacterium]MCG2679451.1 glycoside hydrolase [Kiritimatiellia bacterium]MCG2819442.1 glycoside hydrolase [Actinomycetes bacterium]